ncbi:MAG: tetratricopeptide repeat protein [Pseudomonadota bacterium]
MGNVNELYSEIMSKGPSPGTIYFLLSKLKGEGPLSKIIQECIRALALYPDDISIRRLLAESYYESGLLSQAETELRKVIEQIDDLIPAYRQLTDVYARQGRAEEATQVLGVYLAHRPEDQEALEVMKGFRPEKEIAETVPSMDMAEEIPPMEEVVEEVPEIATPRLAEIYFDQGLLKEAIETYEKVLQRSPEESIRMRLEELSAMMAEEKAAVVDPDRKRKERMIAILEGWLDNIRAGSKDMRTV